MYTKLKETLCWFLHFSRIYRVNIVRQFLASYNMVSEKSLVSLYTFFS